MPSRTEIENSGSKFLHESGTEQNTPEEQNETERKEDSSKKKKKGKKK